MTNGNTFSSMLIVLAMFVVLYFVVVGVFELKKFIARKIKKNRSRGTDSAEQNREGEGF